MKMQYNTKQRARAGERGAALVIAIAIMTVLLAIGLTFYVVSRAEVDNATNVRNRVQADLLVDSALAMAMAELNRDFLKHPNATSNDFRPFALFNGSWAVGKEWALRDGRPLQQGGVPLVPLGAMPLVGFPDGGQERLYSGGRTRDWLYYPRFEGSNPYIYSPNAADLGDGITPGFYEPNSPNRPPFVTPAFYGLGFGDNNNDGNYGMEVPAYPLELIHTWTDVDNDGDGLRDSIWIPIPRDVFFSGGEIIDETTGQRMFDDGVDNNLNGVIDEHPEATGLPMELGTFVYRDDAGNLRLTAPLPGLTIPIDLNADGIVPDFVPDVNGEMVPLTVTLPDTITVRTSAGTETLTANDVDGIDNDLNMLADDYHVYAFAGPNTGSGPPFVFQGFRDTGVPDPAQPDRTFIESIENIGAINSYAAAGYYTAEWRLQRDWEPQDRDLYRTALLKAYEDINIDTTLDPHGRFANFSPATGSYIDPAGNAQTINYGAELSPILRITHSGEPVTELAGRAAILVRDEAGKMNMNEAGGHHYNPVADEAVRSLAAGATTAEVETRVLPGIGVGLAQNLWFLRTGMPKGVATPGYEADVAYPGYGRVDDNANLLLAALSGRDDDGDGFTDKGIFLPEISDMTRRFVEGIAALPGDDPAAIAAELDRTGYAEYYKRLGLFEGVDEPGERQRYRPLLNLQAEDRNPYNVTGFVDGSDNDNDGSVNERGELGDRNLQDTRQLTMANGIGEGISGSLQPLVTAFSTDRNANFGAGREGVRGVNKLDYNFATPPQIAANLLLSNPFESVTARGSDLFSDTIVQSFAEGLKQGDVHIRSSFGGILNGGAEYFPADPVLQTLQAAADIVDNRDSNHARSLLQTERRKATPQSELEAAIYDPWPGSLLLRERIPPAAFFPLGELENHLRDAMGVDRKLTIRDDWWSFHAEPLNPDGGVIGENGNIEERQITYAASGNEAIKINEIMVRAVRRVEAEAVPRPDLPLNASDPMADPAVTAVVPLRNYDPTPFGNGGDPNILPEFDVGRFTSGSVPGAWELQPNPPVGLGGVLGDGAWLQTAVPDQLLQFRIGATDGLPEGRYYLTLDLMDSDFPGAMQLEYLIKYGAPIDTAIAADDAAFQTVPAAHFSATIDGAPNGWVFLDGTPAGAPAGPYFLDGGGNPALEPVPTVDTHTVTVGAGDLYIGIRMTGSLGEILRVNALDFSQEPAHEWLELVNTSDEPVDIGDWELEVGIPDSPPVPRDPFKSTWTIPSGAKIAARGKVLLGFSKFDSFQAGPADHRIGDNGMGLAAGDLPAGFGFDPAALQNVTVPPIGDTSPGAAVDAIFDDTGSVFRRLARSIGPNQDGITDYLDNDGDGRSALYAANIDWNGNNLTLIQEYPGLDNVTNDTAVATTGDLGSPATGVSGNLPWDRIIQLEETSRLTSDNPFSASPAPKRLVDVDTVEDVAALVLRGGVFPNYPERDGIDNDGDGAYLTESGEYIPGILDLDMVDNNLDGIIDQRGISATPFDPTLSEGVDEGGGLYNNAVAGRFYGAGSYEAGVLPLRFFNDRSEYPDDFTDPTDPYLVEDPIAGWIGIAGGPTTLLADDYLGSDADPLDWKVFAERRWYPGDNVIVTLYEGSAINGNVVDRVTYREYDVINRTIDDVVRWDLAYDVVDGLNINYPTLWRPNHMGLDFYRSLERKHPLYNGDRFGTSNRWEATDGNYDDWADSISFFEDDLQTGGASGTTPLLVSENLLGAPRARFLATHPNPNISDNLDAGRNLRLFGHAIWGSPLRMNTAARISEDPLDVTTLVPPFPAPIPGDIRQFPGSRDYFRTHEDGTFAASGTPSLQDQRWNLSRAGVLNQPYQSAGDVMRVPHMTYLHDAINTGDPNLGYLHDMTMLNYGLEGDASLTSYRQDIALRGATLGQDPVDQNARPNVLAAAVNSMATESMVLTVGQAEFRPIAPTAGAVNGSNLLDWADDPATGNPNDRRPPGAWAPVFQFPLERDISPLVDNVGDDQFPNYPPYVDGTSTGELLPLYYLFNSNFLGDAGNFDGINPYTFTAANHAAVNDRWPLEKRVAMYVSENRGPQQPEALFTWDGEDGLENGEYTLYIGTYLPKMRERLGKAARAAAAVVDNPAFDLTAKNTPGLLFGGVADLRIDAGQAPTVSVPVHPVTRSVILRDPTFPGAQGQLFEPVYAIDVITDPSEARGQAPLSSTVDDPTSKPGGLIHPGDWNPPVQYRAGEDGYIFYGANAIGGWKPQTVKVTDNFLALRVRNVGAPGQIGVLTHIVLAPRKRTAGRVNVNTADSRVATVGGNHEFFSTVLGLPGVVDVGRTVQPGDAGFLAGPISPADDVALMSNGLLPGSGWTPPGGPPFSPTEHFYDGTVPPERNFFNDDGTGDSDLLVPDTITGPAAHTVGAFRFFAMLAGGRTEHADGRYYRSVGDLALDSNAFDYNYLLSRADSPDLAGTDPITDTDGVENQAIYPLSNESNPAKRFDEVQARLRRMGNSATTRSDVFEITITVEAGYGVDQNSDGFINYRSSDEFVTTSRTRATAVYERRAPSGLLDGQE